MKMPFARNLFLSLLLFQLTPEEGVAQQDTTRRQTIEITSAYRPVVRRSAKINLTASQLKADTGKNLRPYEIPAQGLYYSYRAVILKPLALDKESGPETGDRNFVKAGFGSYNTPLLRAGIGIGDARDYLFNFYADHMSSKGDLENQQQSLSGLKAAGSYFRGDHEFYGSLDWRNDNYRLYGYDRSKASFGRDEVLHAYRDLKLTGGLRNQTANDLDITYNPEFSITRLAVKDKVRENSFLLNLPLQRIMSEKLLLRVAAGLDISNFAAIEPHVDSAYDIKNNIFSFKPSAEYNSDIFRINFGLQPTWDNGAFVLLPDVKIEAKLLDKFRLLAGWRGGIVKNSFRNLSAINPFMDSLPIPAKLENLNTREVEFFAGIKGEIGKHFSFTGKAGWISYRNIALFVNDQRPDSIGKGFSIEQEDDANNFRVEGQLSYIVQDRFTANASLILNAYSGFKDKAWHTLPLELSASARWKPWKKLNVKSDLYMFNAGSYKSKENSGSARNLKGGVDLTIGAQYNFNSTFSAWLDVNNLFNSKYERWHAFPVLGTGLLAGMLVRF
jgi:hypothetical protein